MKHTLPRHFYAGQPTTCSPDQGGQHVIMHPPGCHHTQVLQEVGAGQLEESLAA